MKKKYDYGWLAKMGLYGICLLGLIYVGISTITVWFGATWSWNLWVLLGRN
jgi:hypothetical protein